MNRLGVQPAGTVLLLMSFVCSGSSEKLARDLEDVTSPSVVNVIVQFAATPGHSQHDKVARFGGLLKAELGGIKAAAYSLPAASLNGLANDPEVLYISPDREISGALDYVGAAMGAQIAQQYGWDGTGVGIAIIDSGITDNRDLQDPASPGSISRVVYSQNFNSSVSGTNDQYGHGTHVAGIAAGNGYASTGSGFIRTFRGIAPNAKVVNLRVLDSNGAGTDSGVIAAINRAIQLKNQYNIRVMNLSLGRPVYESYTKDPLCQAVEQAWKAGIVVVVAAGNEGRNQSQGTNGYATITSPANDPLVITVGAMKTENTTTRADDLIASYSSKGPTLLNHVVKPDLVAPGNRVVSLEATKSILISKSTTDNKVLYSYYQSTSSKSYSADYYRLSGTSMATPVVSGTVALMLQKDWSLTPDTIKARLMKTASKVFPSYSTATDPATNIQYNSQYDIFTIGAGYLDVLAAMDSLDFVAAGSTAASPVAVFDSATNTTRVVNTDTSIWGTVAIWGTAAVWGTVAVWGTTVFLDGQAAVWGTSALWGNAAVWGTSAIKGNAAVWGTVAVWGTSTTPSGEKLAQLITGEN